MTRSSTAPACELERESHPIDQAMAKITASAFVILAIAWSIGCDSRSSSQAGAVELRVIAEPKTGVHEVSAYDPAAVRALAAGQFEHVDYANLPNIIVWL